VLALDTATPVPAIALAGEGFEGESRLPPGRHVSEVLLPALAELLDRAGATLSDVSRVAALSGPGSFTGIRVGLSTAWAFARSLGVPLETVDSLEAIAETARRDERPGSAPVSACLDAERGEIYAATFDLSGPRARLAGEERILPAAEAASLPGRLARPAADGAPSAALAAARAVRRAPGPAAGVPRARYVRASAAEEFHGVHRS